MSIYNPISTVSYWAFTLHYRVFSHEVTADILASQNNEKAATVVSQTNLVGVELFSYVNKRFDGHMGENTL